MKYNCIYITATLILGLLLPCCSSSTENNGPDPGHLYGKWTCRIADGGYAGTDTLDFSQDLNFNDSQNLSYRSSGSGFDFFSGFKFSIGGTWRLESDSIFICYDLNSFIFNLDPESFSVSASAQGADTARLKDLRHDMREDLSRYLNKTFRDRYGDIAGKEVFLGIVNYVGPDSMIISNSGNTLSLHRVL